MTESRTAKAHRLARAGRVLLLHNDPDDGIVALVRGDHDLYLTWIRHDRYECNCPARGVCSHLDAVAIAEGEETT